jgi:adenosine deaminase
MALMTVPKSDLHNHAGRGGCLSTLAKWWGVEIAPPEGQFRSLSEMDNWFQKNVKAYKPGLAGYVSRLEAAFFQAARDGVRLLSMSFGPGEVEYLGGDGCLRDGVRAKARGVFAAYGVHARTEL